ncbi:MAG: mechanosensitive ion channel domain-containing protein [Planctomycetota bacterium]
MAWKAFLAILTALLSVSPAAAQDLATQGSTPSEGVEGAGEPTRTSTRLDGPRGTLETFVEAMERIARGRGASQARQLAEECFDLSETSEAAGREVTGQMADVLSRLGPIEPRWLPQSSSPLLDDGAFVLFPDFSPPDLRARGRFLDARDAADRSLRIEFTRDQNGEWRFSSSTVENLPDLRRALEELPVSDPSLIAGTISSPAEYIRRLVPPRLKNSSFLAVEPWQWIGLALFVFVGFVIDAVVRTLIQQAWRKIARRHRKMDADERKNLKLAVRPFGLLAAALAWFGSVLLLGLPATALLVILTSARVFLTLATVWAAYRAVDLVASVAAARASRTSTKIDDLLIPLVRKAAKVFIAAVGLIYIADAFRFEILPLLTGLGIGGLAFAFAAKDTIENFFGSVAVILDRPFVVGDWVVVDGVEGTVEEMGLRSTRVRTFYNSLITVPNSTLVRAQVDNYGSRKYRRYKTHLNIAYNTPPARIESFCEGIRQLVRDHPYTRKDYFHVWLNSFGPHSLDILVYVFHETPDWGTELRERHRLMLDIIRLAEDLGVEFAFPTQTLQLVRGEAGPPDPSQPGHHEELRSMAKGRRAAKAITSDAKWRREVPPPVTMNGAAELEQQDEEKVEATESSVKQDQTEAKL